MKHEGKSNEISETDSPSSPQAEGFIKDNAQELKDPTVHPQATWEWTPENDRILFSAEWKSILILPGAASLEYTGADWCAQIHEADREGVRHLFSELAHGGKVRMEEVFRLRRFDGCWAWLLLKGEVAENEGEAVIRIKGIIADVSRLRVHPRFHLATGCTGTNSYQSMLENSPDAIARLDRELFPLYANPMHERYLPIPSKQLGGDSLESVGLEAEHINFIQQNVDEVYDTGGVVRAITSFTTERQGEVMGEISFWPEFDEKGEVLSVISHFRDFSCFVESEQRARLNGMRLEALHQLTEMDDAPEKEVMNFVVESMTRLTGSSHGYLFVPGEKRRDRGRMEWSAGHYALFDKADLPLDRIPRTCRAYPDIPLDQVKPVVDNGDGRNIIHKSFSSKLDVMRYMHVPVHEDEQLICLAAVCNKSVNYDETDLQQLELFIKGAWLILRRREFVRTQQAAKEAAERANEAKNEFLTNISHELRTPLNGILSMLQLVNCSDISEEQREYISAAELSGKALLRIISDLLDFSRMESGKMELRPAAFDIKDTIRSTMSLFSVEAKIKGLSLRAHLDESIPPLLLGDDARIRQIFFNLVGNAMKFTERGEIVLECSKLPYAKDNTVWLYFAVRDTGIGIASQAQSIIFDAFTQVDNSRTRKYSGTGLGLGIVKCLISLMGGNIAVESQKGEGTTIHCSLPFVLPRITDLNKEQPVIIAPPKHLRLDVLVAEDDVVSRFALRSFLQKAGHRVVCVNDGRQALEALLLHPFHCLLTDIQMPEMDGLELVRRIRTGAVRDIVPSENVKKIVRTIIPESYARNGVIRPDLVVTAVSAHVMEEDRERFLQEGMDLYLSKPVILNELADVLARIFAIVAPQSTAA